VGNVVVAPERRGKGLGEELVKAALERIAAHGIATTKLCSVPLARTLYERLGFEAEGPVHTYAKVHERPTHRPVEAELLFPEDLGAMLALDHAFGADRRALLRQLLRDYPDTGVGLREGGELRGFAFLKVGEEGSELGPVVLADAGEAAAAQLLDAALGFRLQGPAAAVECSFAASHPFLGSLLAQRGFAFREPPKELMSRGPARAQDWVRCAALAGLEKG
jgi:predicted GNAT family acetyltransferase